MSLFRYAGVDFDTIGLSVEQADGLKAAPPVRGANLLIPYQHGQRPTLKFYNERSVVLQGRVFAATGVLLESYVDRLKALCPIGAGEQKLEVQQLDGSFRYLMAEPRNLLIPTVGQGYPQSTKWSIELVASDPFWYSDVFEDAVYRPGWFLDSGVLLDDGGHWLDSGFAYAAQTLTAQVTQLEATNGGTYFTRKPVFTLVGPSNGLKITNLRNGYSLQLTGAATRAVIDCGAQAINTDAANPAVTLGPGQTDWMRLEAGENTLKVDLGIYSAPVDYQAQYSAAFL